MGKQGEEENNQNCIKVGRKREGEREHALVLMKVLVNCIRERGQTGNDEKHQSLSKK